MTRTDEMMAVSVVTVTTWSIMFWSGPSLVLALLYPYMVLVLVLGWWWAAWTS